jgi:transcriptional regulator with XRE-family HTH domain
MNGRDIARERARRGMSQEELAAQLGVNVSTVGNWETGRTSPARSLPLIEDVFASIPPKAEVPRSGDAFALSPEGRDRLLRALRNLRESADEAIEVLGG